MTWARLAPLVLVAWAGCAPSDVLPDAGATPDVTVLSDAGADATELDAPSPDATADAGFIRLGELRVEDAFAHDVLVAGDTVYWGGTWGTERGIFAVSRTGGTPRAVASPHAAHALVLDGTSLYFLDSGVSDALPGTVFVVPTAGGTATPIAEDEPSPQCLVRDGTTLAWTTRDAVHAIDLAGGAVRELATLIDAMAIAVDPVSHTLVVGGALGITAVPLDGRPTRPITDADAAAVLVIGDEVIFGQHLGDLWRVPFDGSTEPTAMTSGAQYTGGLATDGVSVFFTDGGVGAGADGTVQAVTLADETLTVFPGRAEHLEISHVRIGVAPDALWVGVLSIARFAPELVSIAR